ncbi:hypothetical protein FQV27_14780 [Paracoccus aurantiacus]|uniref:Sulfotransferase family protein n=1 Tax=Paracoccus aurantiacus TaxID=2599412 RepID=A0A5C6S1L3_9RHOB|nr:sulfotransferase [Paracoccus aurantiacus]TXB67859.1 hypothetical protein FQV27_14780 [Paracoccus aurantiacus]
MLPKVFVIGFNKCGTTSLHRMFRRAGHESSHHRHACADGRIVKIARQIDQNARDERPLLSGIDDAQVYSDMDLCERRVKLSGISRFRGLDADYPGSRFILNTRDPLNWVRSRCRHFAGGYLDRSMFQARIADPSVMRAVWLAEWHEHHAAVQTYFAGRPNQLLVFDIEQDSALPLIRFLPEYGLKAGQWRHHNRTPEGVAQPVEMTFADQMGSPPSSLADFSTISERTCVT